MKQKMNQLEKLVASLEAQSGVKERRNDENTVTPQEEPEMVDTAYSIPERLDNTIWQRYMIYHVRRQKRPILYKDQ